MAGGAREGIFSTLFFTHAPPLMAIIIPHTSNCCHKAVHSGFSYWTTSYGCLLPLASWLRSSCLDRITIWIAASFASWSSLARGAWQPLSELTQFINHQSLKRSPHTHTIRSQKSQGREIYGIIGLQSLQQRYIRWLYINGMNEPFFQLETDCFIALTWYN